MASYSVCLPVEVRLRRGRGRFCIQRGTTCYPMLLARRNLGLYREPCWLGDSACVSSQAFWQFWDLNRGTGIHLSIRLCLIASLIASSDAGMSSHLLRSSPVSLPSNVRHKAVMALGKVTPYWSPQGNAKRFFLLFTVECAVGRNSQPFLSCSMPFRGRMRILDGYTDSNDDILQSYPIIITRCAWTHSSFLLG